MKYTTKHVSVVIPNWNGSALLKANLPVVIASVGDAEIIVVDDGSTDDSRDVVSGFAPRVRFIEKPKHEGFASNVNHGVQEAKGDILLLLNSDVRPEKGFLDALLPHFEKPDLFAVGCMDRSMDASEVVLRGRGRAHFVRGFFEHMRGDVTQTNTAWVSCGSGAFRKQQWNDLGGLDTLYNPFYWEDIDLSYRAQKSGYRIAFEPKSTVQHFHLEGKIKKTYNDQFIRIISFRNQLFFIWKNISDPGLLIAHIVWLPIRLVQSLSSHGTDLIRGCIWAFANIPGVLRSRASAAVHWKRSDRDVLTECYP